MVREILQLGDPLLREVSEEVPDPEHPEIQRVRADLRDTLHDFQRRNGFGRGISAVQIGDLVCVIYIEIGGRAYTLINPRLVEESPGKLLVWDDCFSIPGLLVRLVRAAWVRVEYLDEHDQPVLLQASDDFSELLQHELDHLDGILAIDRALDKHSFTTRTEYERRYRGERVVPLELRD